MTSRKIEKLPRREREIMDVLFASGGYVSAEEIRARLSEPPSYSAVRAMLARLEGKGFVRHREEGLRYVYAPAINLYAAQRAAIQQVVKTYFGGSPGDTATALLKEERWTDAELDSLTSEIEKFRRQRRGQ